MRWIALILLQAAGLSLALQAAPRADYWDIWDRSDQADQRAIDHSLFADFLERYLVTDTTSGVNLLRYGAVGATDRQTLTRYITALEATSIRNYNRNEQMAFWINLYNAVTLKLILDHYPVASIRDIDISPGLFASGPWDAELAEVEGIALTLNDIEHRILRPLWQDPRIHYAVNCASWSCPNLAPVPYTSTNLENLLDRMAADYVSHPRGVKLENGRLTLSSIYNWYEADFGGNLEGVVSHLREYAPPQLARQLSDFTGRARYKYNWELNEAP